MDPINGKRLYVGNLSPDVRIDAIRARFAAYGGVADVYIANDRASGHSLGYAFVTRDTVASARAATDGLDGAMFEGKPLRVNEAGANREDGGGRKERSNNAKAEKTVAITSQFREKQNMSYELDCGGATLWIRVFPVERESEGWRLEASIRGAAEVSISSGICPSRALALDEIVRAWPIERAPVDWPAVMTAMAGVRAI